MRFLFLPVFALGVFLFMAAANAGANPAPVKLPPEIIDSFRNLEDQCREDPTGLVKTNLRIVEQADLTGDGIADYMFEDSGVPCEAGANYRDGNGGNNVYVFLGLKNGHARLVYNGAAVAARIQDGKILITMGGTYCVQSAFTQDPDNVTCDIPLIWDTDRHAFYLAHH